EIAKPENLAKIQAALDEHKAKTGNDQIVVYCYTGHSGGLVTAVLGALGYNVKNLKFGFCGSWNNDAALGCGKPVPTPINGMLEKAGVKKPAEEEKPAPAEEKPAPPAAPKKGICGPTAIVIFAVLPLLPIMLLRRRN
ncbi:MAG: hypothetical protein DRN88_03270, partial [Candidatus Hydrothermarchaeota archaeon]